VDFLAMSGTKEHDLVQYQAEKQTLRLPFEKISRKPKTIFYCRLTPLVMLYLTSVFLFMFLRSSRAKPESSLDKR